jgi:hypothetical protein
MYNAVSLDVPTITDVNSPHYSINNYYWNGSEWALSSNTYATSMSYANWITNIATFPSGQLGDTVTIKVIFQDSNIISSISDILFTMNESTYEETSVILPEMYYSGDGFIKLLNAVTSTYAGSPKVLIEIERSGENLYWNGIEWVVSDGTYVQSTDFTTFNLHCTSLDVVDKKYGQFTIVFPDSNIISSMSLFTANMKVLYFSDNPITVDSDYFVLGDGSKSLSVSRVGTDVEIVVRAYGVS